MQALETSKFGMLTFKAFYSNERLNVMGNAVTISFLLTQLAFTCSKLTMCEICSELIIKISERHHWPLSGIFIVNFEHILHLVPVFLLLTLNMYLLVRQRWVDVPEIGKLPFC